MSEIGDVTDLLWAFERHNHCSVQMRTETELVNGKVELKITMAAWDVNLERSEASLWGLVSVRCSTTNLRTFRDAVTHVLYALDLKLVLREFDGKTSSG
jgi:hypothetical protein